MGPDVGLTLAQPAKAQPAKSPKINARRMGEIIREFIMTSMKAHDLFVKAYKRTQLCLNAPLWNIGPGRPIGLTC